MVCVSVRSLVIKLMKWSSLYGRLPQQNLQMEDDGFANVHEQVDRIWSQMLCLMFVAKVTQKQCLHMP